MSVGDRETPSCARVKGTGCERFGDGFAGDRDRPVPRSVAPPDPPVAQLRLTAVVLSTKVAQMIDTALDVPSDPADRLAAVVALRRLADRVEDAEVERALREGWTWSEVAEALGVTRQAVHKKHAKRLTRAVASERRQ
jgi:hypothetical protein